MISVIVPTYNYSDFICEAIDSVLRSDFTSGGIEIIVVDDGSTDDTVEKLKKYQGQIKYISQGNLGKAQATKVAIDHTNGQYIFNLDADDLFYPEKIRKVVDIFESDPEIIYVAHPLNKWYCESGSEDVEYIPKMFLNRKFYGKDLLSYLYRRNLFFGGSSAFAARSDVLKTFSIPREVDMYIDEYLVIATLNQPGYAFFLEEPLGIWRVHGQNFTHKDFVTSRKLQRNLASVEAVLDQLPNLGVEEEIIKLYHLKMISMSLWYKELLQEKS